MSREIHGAPMGRCLCVWLFATAATMVVLLALGPELAAAHELTDARADVRFDALLTVAAAVALAVSTLWFWMVATVVVAQALTGRLRSVRGCPDAVRRLVLIACGLALATAVTSPAVADSTAGRPPAPDEGPAVSGLPLPDRVVAPPGSRPSGHLSGHLSGHPVGQQRPGDQVDGIHVVAAGDTLWEIAARSLPGAASNADIDQRWRDIWVANREAIGLDPDLIHPGATLHLPSVKES